MSLYGWDDVEQIPQAVQQHRRRRLLPQLLQEVRHVGDVGDELVHLPFVSGDGDGGQCVQQWHGQAGGHVGLGETLLEQHQHLQVVPDGPDVRALLHEGGGLGLDDLEVLLEGLCIAVVLEQLEGLSEQVGQVGLVTAGLGEEVDEQFTSEEALQGRKVVLGPAAEQFEPWWYLWTQKYRQRVQAESWRNLGTCSNTGWA